MMLLLWCRDLCAESEAASDDTSSLKRRQSFQLAKPSAANVCKKEDVAAAIAAFAGGYHPGQKAIVKSDGLPKLTRLLTSASPAVQDKALSAMLVRDISQMHICMMPICAETPGSTAGEKSG